jgi:hypothetical protein
MRVQINSDKNITVDSRVIGFVRTEVDRAIDRFRGRLTRVEVHLSDVNSSRKSGPQDKRCMIEARPAGAKPLAVTMSAARVPTAVRGALGKLRRALETFFARTGNERRIARQAAPKQFESKARPRAKKAAASTAAPRTRRAPAVKVLAAGASPVESSTEQRSAKPKPIYQARRKSWPKR